jgi:hypothetical protein
VVENQNYQPFEDIIAWDINTIKIPRTVPNLKYEILKIAQLKWIKLDWVDGEEWNFELFDFLANIIDYVF